jgi:flagellar assembly protein FliH
MSRAHSSFIPAEQINAVADWNFGAVDQAAIRFAAKLKAQAEAEARALDTSAPDKGYSEGYAAGFEQGHAQATLEGQRQINEYIASQGQAAARNFLAMFEAAQTQLVDAEQALAKGVLEMACELARQVLRHELTTNPNALQPVVREALGILASDSKAAMVRLNPLDVDVFSEVLQKEFANLSLTLLPDPAVSQGGCLVESGGTVVDGTVERRWQRAVAGLGLASSWEAADDTV